MKNPSYVLPRFLLCAAAGLLAIVVFGQPLVSAQAPDAADRCTPDVMRLCSEFVPDPDRIVACLKAKRRQLSSSCLTALQPVGGKKQHRPRHAI